MRIPPMTLRFSLSFVLVALSLAACGGGRGWPQSERDALIGGCVQQAKAGGGALDEAKLRNYCSCYQQNVEKSFPDVKALKTVKAEDVAKEAQKCVELMFQ